MYTHTQTHTHTHHFPSNLCFCLSLPTIYVKCWAYPEAADVRPVALVVGRGARQLGQQFMLLAGDLA